MIWRWSSFQPTIDVTVFTREGCHLCDEAISLLRSRARRHGLVITMVDITENDAHFEKYVEKIPVVRVQGRDRFFGQVDPVLLDRLLNSLSQ